MGALSVLPPFGDLFKSTKIEVVQSVVASEQLEDLIKWIVAELNAVSETQKNCNCRDLLEKVDHLMSENSRASSDVLKLREAQETYQGQIRELEVRTSGLHERLEVLEGLPKELEAHIEEEAARHAEFSALSNVRGPNAWAPSPHQHPSGESMGANARGTEQHQILAEADTAIAVSTTLSTSPEEQQTGTTLQSNKSEHAPSEGGEPDKPQRHALGNTEKEIWELRDTCTHHQEELMEVKRQVNTLKHAMSEKASCADMQAVVSSLAHQFPTHAAELEDKASQGVPQEEHVPLPSSSDIQITLLHQRLSSKADTAVVEELRQQVLDVIDSMHGFENSCQKQVRQVMEELEFVRTAPLLPMPAAAPSSLILDIMHAAEGAAMLIPYTPHQQASASIPYNAHDDLEETGSKGTMPLNLSVLQSESTLEDSTHEDTSSSSPSQLPSLGATNADDLAQNLAPQKVGMVSDQAAASKQDATSGASQEEGVQPERAMIQKRNASVVAALHALEQRVAALHQHLSRVQLESRSDRLQLGRLAKDVQTCLEGGVSKAARWPPSDLPQLPASNTPARELSALDKVAGIIKADGSASGELIGAATLKEAQVHAELLELRRAVETVTAVTSMMALGRQEGGLGSGRLEGTNMEATITALAHAMEAHQVHKRDFEDPPVHPRDLVASSPHGPEWKDEKMLNVGSELATLKHIVLELMHAQRGLTNAAHPQQVILARKPIPGFRCMSCNRPVADLDGLPRSPLPAKQSSSADAMLCKGMHRESHAVRMRPRTATSSKVTGNTSNKGTGAVSLHGSPPRLKGRVDPVAWGPKLPPGGWTAIVDKDAAHDMGC